MKRAPRLGRGVDSMNGIDIQIELHRTGEQTAMLNECVECEQVIVMAFLNDYLCLWCRYTTDTGLFCRKPDDRIYGGTFTATPPSGKTEPTVACKSYGHHYHSNGYCNRCLSRKSDDYTYT